MGYDMVQRQTHPHYAANKKVWEERRAELQERLKRLKATPEWRRAQREARKREEDEYAAHCGPVTTKKISDAMTSVETP